MSGFINYNGFSLSDTPPLTSKVAIVTGGNAGIGRDIVAQFLLHDISKVIILARSNKKYEASKPYWKETHGLDIPALEADSRVEFISCDLSDITIVKKVADSLVSKLDRLDILVNNAGLPTIPDYTLSPQGIETIWATNVVGSFVLTNVLLELIERTAERVGDTRVVVTSSSFHMGCQELDLDSTMSKERVKSPDAIDSCWRYARRYVSRL